MGIELEAKISIGTALTRETPFNGQTDSDTTPAFNVFFVFI